MITIIQPITTHYVTITYKKTVPRNFLTQLVFTYNYNLYLVVFTCGLAMLSRIDVSASIFFIL